MLLNNEVVEEMPTIKIIGVGHRGEKSVNYMLEQNITDVEFYAINTDGDAEPYFNGRPVSALLKKLKPHTKRQKMSPRYAKI